MYLAEQMLAGKKRYFIRESIRKDGAFVSRDIVDLGFHPEKYVRYPGGNAYYFDETIEDNILAINPDAVLEDLDTIFWPFVRPDIKRAVSAFRSRERLINRTTIDSNAVNAVHLFDKRRIHYLRFAQSDQGAIGKIPPKLLLPVMRKSRDEIEQYFIQSERILDPGEQKTYVFVVFDLQRFFTELTARRMPEGLDQKKTDALFLTELCRLNQNPAFWSGTPMHFFLHAYLIRYLFMFFDNDYRPSQLWDEYYSEWMNTKRGFHPPIRPSVSLTDASTIFGVGRAKLKAMNKRDLTRLFRKAAHEHHPDKGGDQKKFICLCEAYRSLVEKKKKSHAGA